MSSTPIVLVINYNENNQPPDEIKLNEILNKIKSHNPDIFILTTQNSRSGTNSHIHHSVKEKIENSKKRKYLRSNTDIELLLKKYNLFSKIDATRKSNSNLGFFNSVKPYNVRTRIWINSETVYQGFTKNFSANKYTSTTVKANPSSSENYNTSVGTDRFNNSAIPAFYNSKIKIEDYSYRRTTVNGNNGKNGNGSIMISICLIGVDKKYYQYIIGNINPKGSIQINANETQKIFFDMIEEGNVIRYLSTQNTEQKFRGQIFILYISKDNCLYKKIEDNTVNNITTLSTIKNLNDKKIIDEKSLKFFQMDNVSKINTIMTTIKTNFGILKTNIQRILIHCDKPITKKSINTFISGNNTSLVKHYILQKFSFDSILKDLEYMKKYIDDKNLKNEYKDLYESINKYLNIWKRINETLFIFTDQQKKNKSSEINAFLTKEVNGYTSSSNTSSNNYNNQEGRI